MPATSRLSAGSAATSYSSRRPSDQTRRCHLPSYTDAGEVNGAILAPVQSVYAHGGKFYAFVYDGGAWEARPVTTGPTNDKFFVIEQGLNEGDEVLVDPGSSKDNEANI